MLCTSTQTQGQNDHRDHLRHRTSGQLPYKNKKFPEVVCFCHISLSKWNEFSTVNQGFHGKCGGASGGGNNLGNVYMTGGPIS